MPSRITEREPPRPRRTVRRRPEAETREGRHADGRASSDQIDGNAHGCRAPGDRLRGPEGVGVAVSRPVTRLLVPGPDVTRQTPGRSVSRPTAAADDERTQGWSCSTSKMPSTLAPGCRRRARRRRCAGCPRSRWQEVSKVDDSTRTGQYIIPVSFRVRYGAFH
ncbi:hypothetical protein VTN96DRAFT_5082 [Rasamsonia emersonii]